MVFCECYRPEMMLVVGQQQRHGICFPWPAYIALLPLCAFVSEWDLLAFGQLSAR